MALAGAARADSTVPASGVPPAKPPHTPVVSRSEAVTFGLVLGALAAADRPLWRLFDTDLSQPPGARDRWPRDVSALGDGSTLVVVSALPMLLDGKHGREAGTKAWKALATTSIAVTGLKFLVGKERPTQTGGQIRFRGPGLGDTSFPSGHTAAAFAVATVMAYEYPRYRYVFWGLAAAVGVARISSGSHFPSDVWAGAGLGTYLGRRAVRGNTQLFSWSF